MFKVKFKKKIEKNFQKQNRVKAFNFYIENNMHLEELSSLENYMSFYKILNKNKKIKDYKFWLVGYSQDFFDEKFLDYNIEILHPRITPINLYGNVKVKFLKDGNFIKIFKIMELNYSNFIQSLELNRIFNQSYIIASKRPDIISDKSFNKICNSFNEQLPKWHYFYRIDWVDLAINIGKYSDFVIRGRGDSSHEAYVQVLMDEHIDFFI